MPFPNSNTQFKKGVSGNPKGRPKGAKNLTTILSELIRRKYSFIDVPKTYLKDYLKGKKLVSEKDASRCVFAFLDSQKYR